MLKLKGEALNDLEVGILEERIKYAKIWLEKYAPDEFKMQMSEELPKEVSDLTSEQKEYLAKAKSLLEDVTSAEDLQLKLYELSKKLNIDAKSAFGAIYTAMIGKTHGPKAGAFLLQYPKEKIIERLNEAAKK